MYCFSKGEGCRRYLAVKERIVFTPPGTISIPSIVRAHDLCIAAVVMQQEGSLVTRNTEEFRMIEGLMVEDWALPGTME